MSTKDTICIQVFYNAKKNICGWFYAIQIGHFSKVDIIVKLKIIYSLKYYK